MCVDGAWHYAGPGLDLPRSSWPASEKFTGCGPSTGLPGFSSRKSQSIVWGFKVPRGQGLAELPVMKPKCYFELIHNFALYT